MPDAVSDFEEEWPAEEDILEADETLTIRVDRSGELDVRYGAVELSVASIDIDEVSLSRLERQPGRVRG